MIDAVKAATSKWTRQKKSEERHPGMRRYRVVADDQGAADNAERSRMGDHGGAYMAASDNGTLPAKARQIYYQARPKIMAMTDEQALWATDTSPRLCCPTTSKSTASDWNVVYDARGHLRGAAHQSAHRLSER